MTPLGDADTPGEDRLADLLAAYDPAAAGDTPPTWDGLDPVSRGRLESARLVVDRLNLLSPRPNPSLTPPPSGFPFAFGRFRARGKLGSGGCGVVFLADDPVLGRPVALKVPRPDVLSHPDLQRRFLREAQAAAILSHPNIVPVFEAGTVGGVCYIAAEYCPGPTLARWLERAGRPVPAGHAAGLVAALAAGIGYAHRRGVVHRDLKPSNILLGPGGKAVAPGGPWPPLPGLVPRVADFGFAKLLERDQAATQTGVIVGTPLYMAPEQAEGRAAAVGPPTDVYALGAVLYELLVGRPPLVGASAADTLRRIVAETAAPPRSVRPDVPRDLEAICRKCLAKDPGRRYPDGDALAADLGRFLSAQPTLARPVRWPEQVGMWARRNPVVATLGGLATTSLVLLAAIGWMYQRDLAENNVALQASLAREHAAALTADRQRDLAVDRFRLLRRRAYLAEIREAAGLADREVLTDRSIGAWDPEHGEDLRGFEWRYLTRLARATRTWPGHQGPVSLGRVTDDGRWVATVAGREVRLWDMATGRVAAGWTHSSDLDNLAAVSADGRFVASVPVDREAGVLLFTHGNQVPRVIEKTRGLPTYQIEFAANDHLLVVAGPTLGVYDAPTGTLVRTLGRDRHIVGLMGVNPDGLTAIVNYFPTDPTRSASSVVRYDIPSGREHKEGTVPPRMGLTALSSDGRYLVLNTLDKKESQVWDVAELEVRATFRFPAGGPAKSADRLADGRLAVATWPDPAGGGREIELAVWDPRDGRWATSRVIPPCLVQSVRFRPDGRGLLVGGMDSMVHMMELVRPAPEAGWPVGGKYEAWAVAVSPDGRTIVTGGDDHAVRVWDARTGACRAARTDHGALVTAAAFAPDGGWFATGSFDGRVVVRDPRSAAPRQVLAHGHMVRTLAVSPDGRAVAAAGETGAVSVWDVGSGLLRYRLDGTGGRVHAILFSADGKALLAAPSETEMVWWDGATGRRVHGVNLRLRPSCLALSPDGQTLAVGYETGQVVFLDAATGQEQLRACGSHSRLNAVAFSPDGKTLAAGAVDGSVRLWHVGTGTELFAIARGGPQVNGVAFAPDGSFLAATRHDGRLLLWPAGDPAPAGW
ncbi:MAG: prkC 15 [Gemmataceae bacterium]|nr:prkC 15 [Gemmataceae bacterium]